MYRVDTTHTQRALSLSQYKYRRLHKDLKSEIIILHASMYRRGILLLYIYMYTLQIRQKSMTRERRTTPSYPSSFLDDVFDAVRYSLTQVSLLFFFSPSIESHKTCVYDGEGDLLLPLSLSFCARDPSSDFFGIDARKMRSTIYGSVSYLSCYFFFVAADGRIASAVVETTTYDAPVESTTFRMIDERFRPGDYHEKKEIKENNKKKTSTGADHR